MFQVLLENNYEEKLKEDAIETIVADRARYGHIHTAILEFIVDKAVLVSSVDLLLDRHKYWNVISLYSIAAEDIAKKLLVRLCEIDPGFDLRIDDVGKEYTIGYDARIMCTIQNMEIYHSMSLYEYISPSKFMNINLFPPLLEVIKLYGILANPAKASDWIDILTDIRILEKKYIYSIIEDFVSKDRESLIKLFTTSINNGRIRVPEETVDPSVEPSLEPKTICQEIKKINIINLKELIIEFLESTDYIILGNLASMISDTAAQPPAATPDKPAASNDSLPVRIISYNSIEDDFKYLIEFLSKHTTYGYIYKAKNVYLPNDIMLKKHVVYLMYYCETNRVSQKPLVEIYNTTSYQMLSYKDVKWGKLRYKLADPIVETWFIYIEIWSVIIAQKVYGLNYEKFKEHIQDTTKFLKKNIKAIDIYSDKTCVGWNLDQFINKKILLLNVPQSFKSRYMCSETSLL